MKIPKDTESKTISLLSVTEGASDVRLDGDGSYGSTRH
jgi:hypothetical protein